MTQETKETTDEVIINAYEIEDESSIFKAKKGTMAVTPRDKGIIFIGFPKNERGDFVIPRNFAEALIPVLAAYTKGESLADT